MSNNLLIITSSLYLMVLVFVVFNPFEFIVEILENDAQL